MSFESHGGQEYFQTEEFIHIKNSIQTALIIDMAKKSKSSMETTADRNDIAGNWLNTYARSLDNLLQKMYSTDPEIISRWDDLNSREELLEKIREELYLDRAA